MSGREMDSSQLLVFQLGSKPVANEAVRSEQGEDGRVRVTVPLKHRGWSSALSHILPLSAERNVELDVLGTQTLSQCDGEHTVEDLIDWFEQRWQLSFFEARGLILHFLEQLMKRGLIAVIAPPDSETNSTGTVTPVERPDP